MKKNLLVIFLLFAIATLAACSKGEKEMALVPNHSSVTELKTIDLLEGDGKQVRNNHRVAVHYTGWLYDEAAVDNKGKKFDSSYDRNRPFVFSIGNKDVIAGWENGILGMKVGGKRSLIIPPELGYGSKGAGSSIPPNAALVFEIELLQAGE